MYVPTGAPTGAPSPAPTTAKPSSAPTSLPTSVPTSFPTKPSSQSNKSVVNKDAGSGSTVGAAVGGTAGVLCCLLAGFMYRRKKKAEEEEEDENKQRTDGNRNVELRPSAAGHENLYGNGDQGFHDPYAQQPAPYVTQENAGGYEEHTHRNTMEPETEYVEEYVEYDPYAENGESHEYVYEVPNDNTANPMRGRYR